MIRFLIKQQFAWAEKCFDMNGEIKKPFEPYFASFINQVLKDQKKNNAKSAKYLDWCSIPYLFFKGFGFDTVSN